MYNHNYTVYYEIHAILDVYIPIAVSCCSRLPSWESRPVGRTQLVVATLRAFRQAFHVCAICRVVGRLRTPGPVLCGVMPKRALSLDSGASAPSWFEEMYSGAMSDEYKAYMANEWGHEKRGDEALFEKLSLEGAQAGLSWAVVLAKRDAYRRAFHGFDIEKCAAMTSAEVDKLVTGDGTSGPNVIVRHRGKIQSVVTNAKCVQRLISEAQAAGQHASHGHFDSFLWSFVGGSPMLNDWPNGKAIPSESDVSHAMSKALKARGFAFVGPKCCYSLMQSCGLVIDHPKGTPEWLAASARLTPTGSTDEKQAKTNTGGVKHITRKALPTPGSKRPTAKRSRQR